MLPSTVRSRRHHRLGWFGGLRARLRSHAKVIVPVVMAVTFLFMLQYMWLYKGSSAVLVVPADPDTTAPPIGHATTSPLPRDGQSHDPSSGTGRDAPLLPTKATTTPTDTARPRANTRAGTELTGQPPVAVDHPAPPADSPADKAAAADQHPAVTSELSNTHVHEDGRECGFAMDVRRDVVLPSFISVGGGHYGDVPDRCVMEDAAYVRARHEIFMAPAVQTDRDGGLDTALAPGGQGAGCMALWGNNFHQVWSADGARRPLDSSRTWDRALPDNHVDYGDPKSHGWMQCYKSDTTEGSLCVAQKARLDLSQISLSRGDETIESVLGRSERDEYVHYEGEVLQLLDVVTVQGTLPAVDTRRLSHWHKLIMAHVGVASSPDELHEEGGAHHQITSALCAMRLPGTTLVVQRYEYANVYHQMTDWYATYQALRMTVAELGEDARGVNVLFWDGHARSGVDKVWSRLFGNRIYYVGHLKAALEGKGLGSAGVCLDRMVLVEAGYASPLAPRHFRANFHRQACVSHVLLMEFVQHFWRSFGFGIRQGDGTHPVTSRYCPPTHKGPFPVTRAPGSRPHVVLLLRHNYRAHPRQKGGPKPAAKRKLANEDEVVTYLSGHQDAFSFEAVAFEELGGVRAQLEVIARTDILVGVHGAGLSWGLLMQGWPAAMVELTSSSFASRIHFKYFSRWAGLDYRTVLITGAGSRVDPRAVADEIKKAAAVITAKRNSS